MRGAWPAPAAVRRPIWASMDSRAEGDGFSEGAGRRARSVETRASEVAGGEMVAVGAVRGRGGDGRLKEGGAEGRLVEGRRGAPEKAPGRQGTKAGFMMVEGEMLEECCTIAN